MPVYNKRGILLLPKVIVLNPKDGYLKAAHMAVNVNDRSLEEIAEEIYQEAHK